MSDTIRKILNTASDSEAIEIINENFKTITERIKQQNINISYLDLLRLDTVWTDSYSSTPNSTDRLNNFISTVWNTLANYSGVFIQYTANAGEEAFIVPGSTDEKVYNCDFLVKLPGSQFLHIPGARTVYYVPYTYSNSGGSVIYTYTTNSAAASSPTISVPSYASTGYQVFTYTNISPNIQLTPTASIRSVRWFKDGEEVLWSGSHATLVNHTTLTLDAVMIGK